MSRVRVFILLLGLFGIGTSLACGGMGDISLPSADLTDPWKGMDMPIDDGTVLYSDASTLSVQYTGNKVKEVAPKFIKAFEKAGFKKQNESESGDTIAVVFQKDGKNCSVAITTAMGNTMVAASIQ